MIWLKNCWFGVNQHSLLYQTWNIIVSGIPNLTLLKCPSCYLAFIIAWAIDICRLFYRAIRNTEKIIFREIPTNFWRTGGKLFLILCNDILGLNTEIEFYMSFYEAMWAIVITFRPSSVVCCPSVNISHFNLLLRNH